MSAALIAALVFTVILFVVTAYFLMGSLPLLILKHDTPLDARFVAGFFDTQYRIAIVAAGATALSYALAGRIGFAAGAAAIAGSDVLLRRKLIPTMAALRSRIEAGEADAIAGFRRLHVAAIAVNAAQLVLIVWSVVRLSIQMK